MKMYLKNSVVAVAFSFTALLSIAAQAETVLVKGNSKGNDVVVKLDSSMAGKVIAIFAQGATPNSQTLDLGVKGVGGEIITVESFATAGGQAAEAAIESGTNPIVLTQNGKSIRQITLTDPRSSSSSSSSSKSSSSSSSNPASQMDPNCGCLTPEQQDIQFAGYHQYTGGSKDQFCSIFPQFPNGCGGGFGFGNGSSSSTNIGNGKFSNGISTTASAFIPYNRCLAAAKPGVVVKIDLANVDPASLVDAELTVATKIRAFKGPMKATIKPSSEGRFGPGPILLTAPVYGYSKSNGSDLITMTNWAGKRVKRIRKLKVVQSLSYGGQRYLEAVLSGYLTGGKGTIEVYRGAEGYAYCAKFVRVRQMFNGYKKLG